MGKLVTADHMRRANFRNQVAVFSYWSETLAHCSYTYGADGVTFGSMHTACMRPQAAIPQLTLADAARFTHPGLQQVSSSACCAGGCFGVFIR